MEYNTERKPLIIPEYGRHMQEMVDYCMSIEDREKRNEFAGIIIEVMGVLNPHLRDVDDFQHKLWDQLFIMSNFSLDVDSPFSGPRKNRGVQSSTKSSVSAGRIQIQILRQKHQKND